MSSLLIKCQLTLLLSIIYSSIMSLLNLLTELLFSILQYINIQEQKQARQTYRSLSELITPLHFKEINFKLAKHGCESLHNIFQNYMLNYFIQTIALYRVYICQTFTNFNVQVECIHQLSVKGYAYISYLERGIYFYYVTR